MSDVVLDFSNEKKFRIKTRKGEAVMREPIPAEYFKYMGQVRQKDEDDVEAMYKVYIEYFKILGGESEKLESLNLFELFEVAKVINGGEVEKK